MAPNVPGLKVFAGSSHPALAQEICQQLGIPLGRANTKRFSNENLKIRIEENVREKDVFVDRRTTVIVTLARTKPVCPRSWRNFHVSRILETSK